MKQPNILFIMTDQQRFDTIAALGNPHIYTPAMDRLVARGLSFTNAYSTCPVCVPARYTIRTGCEPPRTRVFTNSKCGPAPGQPQGMEQRCGPYLARTLSRLGYRTFGIGKFHANDEDLGYELHLRAEEGSGEPWNEHVRWLRRNHPEFSFIEQLHGERTDLYYAPQLSPVPAALTQEGWTTDQAIAQLRRQDDDRPWFGLISFIGPHPPLAPPVPFNRMYDPDRMPDPVVGSPAVDHADDQIPWMNHAVFSESIDRSLARKLKARYYGDISFIDHCVGRILDTVDASPEGENTLICFFSDHGDHLGDHNAWQKESFFDASCRIPFLLSWPAAGIDSGQSKDELVCLADLFGIATAAATGRAETRDGVDVVGALAGKAEPREHLFGLYGRPGLPEFKIMVRDRDWKYIFLANGGRELLFRRQGDPHEVCECAAAYPEAVTRLREVAVVHLAETVGMAPALADGALRRFPFSMKPRERIYQFQAGGTFPDRPCELYERFQPS